MISRVITALGCVQALLAATAVHAEPVCRLDDRQWLACPLDQSARSTGECVCQSQGSTVVGSVVSREGIVARRVGADSIKVSVGAGDLVGAVYFVVRKAVYDHLQAGGLPRSREEEFISEQIGVLGGFEQLEPPKLWPEVRPRTD